MHRSDFIFKYRVRDWSEWSVAAADKRGDPAEPRENAASRFKALVGVKLAPRDLGRL